MDLIGKLAEQKPRLRYRCIQGELVKLGHSCSHYTVRKVLRRHGMPPVPRRSQRSWRELVRQHADQILATDFFAFYVSVSVRPGGLARFFAVWLGLWLVDDVPLVETV